MSRRADIATRQTAVKPQTSTSKTGSVTPRKQSAISSRTHDVKQVRKVAGENIASKPVESPRRIRRSMTDLEVSPAKSSVDIGAELTNAKPPRRSEKPAASRSSSGGRRSARNLLQSSATELTESLQQIDISQLTDEVHFRNVNVFSVLYMYVTGM